MGCTDIGRKKRRYNNNIDNGQSIILLKQRYEDNKNKLKFNFDQKIKGITEKYNKSKQEEEAEYTTIKNKYEYEYQGKTINLESKFEHQREFQKNKNDEFKQEEKKQYHCVKTIKTRNENLDLESIKNRMKNELNYLIWKQSNNINWEYKYNREEKKENDNYENNHNESANKENENDKNNLDKHNQEYQNDIANMEEKYKNNLNNLKNKYESQLEQANIENNENSQKLKDYYDEMIKARKVYEEMNRDIKDKKQINNNDNNINKENDEYDLEVIEYSDNNETKFQFKECLICMEEFKNEEKIAILKCEHCYHDDCIKDWIKRAKGIFCPFCQADGI